jgi:hypothetical protein
MRMTVALGFEVGTGKPVSIPLRHMVVTGQTQEAGKTTTLEALIARANLPAIAFVTKRGERSFGEGRRIPPYFRERADWQFVASVLEATMRERLKFERAWIMRASKGARTLADVHKNVRKQMETAKGLSADVYLTLDAYLEIVVPRVAQVLFAATLDLAPGLNVLDLSDRDRFPPELQSLVMRSALEWVYEKCDGTISIIPEAWEFLPQGRGSPVKLAAVELIRKGAGLSNYVWLDSQDIGGVDKELLRSCPVWLLGVQREANEIKRVLDNIPAGIAKPRPADVAKLQKGQFYACFGESVIKTYVQPAWMLPSEACGIALGKISVEQTVSRPTPAPITKSEEEPMSKAVEEKLEILIGLMSGRAATEPAAVSSPAPAAPALPEEDALYQRFKTRLMKEAPGLIKLLVNRPEIQISEHRAVIEIDLSSAQGMVAKLISEGFFDQPVTGSAAHKETKRRWNYGGNGARVYEQLDKLTSLGFVTKEPDGYRAVTDMKLNIKKAA